MYNSDIVYHIYNQSNNYELLFRSDDNYRFFLKKLRRELLPHGDILCYCLMPDHFHLMVKPTKLGCLPSRSGRYLRSDEPGAMAQYQQNLSHAIKTLLSSYTQAINKRYNRRGSLFKAKTKAKPAYHQFCPEELLLLDDQPLAEFIPYLKICFDYIHNNPVKAKFVDCPLEWEHSSALDYDGFRDDSLCNFDLSQKILGISKKNRYSGPTA
jgi:putative transposase